MAAPITAPMMLRDGADDDFRQGGGNLQPDRQQARDQCEREP
jgi:hypothetical protein